MNKFLAALAITLPLVSGGAYADAIEVNAANFAVTTDDAGKQRYVDPKYALERQAYMDALKERCTTTACRTEVFDEFHKAGRLRGRGYCEAHWSELPRDELEHIFELISEAYSKAPNRPIFSSKTGLPGEVYYEDFDIERRCVYGLLSGTNTNTTTGVKR